MRTSAPAAKPKRGGQEWTPAGAGGGKGGGSAHVPHEAKDTLKSSAVARVLDLLSEGEIEGLVDGAKSIYLDGTPLENPDGSLNFEGVSWSLVPGTQAQAHIPGFPEVERTISVGTQIKLGPPAVSPTFTITDTDVDAVRVDIGIPVLFKQRLNGDVIGQRVEYMIELNTDGGGYVEIGTFAIKGKTRSRFVKPHRITLPAATTDWVVRVSRITADSGLLRIQNETWLDSYTEIIDAKLRYPNSAVIGLEVPAEQFSRVPQRGYECKLLQVQIPSNYTPTTRVYTGIWDGTFSVAWTDNPAWCFYDLLTTSRYGLGEFVDAAQVDKWALYTIGQYCDALVDDGVGGQEPRFTCNLYLQTRREAYQVLQDMASVFRGMLYWGAGQIVPVQDSPGSAVAQFTPANVVRDDSGVLFHYEGSARRARHNVALVQWVDPTDGYTAKMEYVEDQDSIAADGVLRQTQVVAVGATSRGQAHRVGKWLLFSEKFETETVAFVTGLDASYVRPGDVIHVVDPHRAGARMGGRVSAATTTQVTLDGNVTISAGQTYDLSIVLPNGNLEERAVTNAPGTTNVLTVGSAFTEAAQAQAIWVLVASNLEPQPFKVLAVQETDRHLLHVTALKHHAAKYDAVEQDIKLEPLKTSILDPATPPAPPRSLVLTEELYEKADHSVANRLVISWDPSTTLEGIRYRVEYVRDELNPVVAGETRSQGVELDDVQPGIFTVRVWAINAVGQLSTPATLTQEVFGKTAKPADVTNFRLVPVNDTAHLSWDLHPDLDVRLGGYFRIRHTPRTTGAAWLNGVDLLSKVAGNATSAPVPLLAGTYMITVVDSGGREAENPALVVTTVPNILGLNVVQTEQEDPTFPGTKTNTVVVDSALRIGNADLFDNRVTLMDTWANFDTESSGVTSGSYSFQNTVDLGAVYLCRLTSDVDAAAFNEGDSWDAREGNIDTWASIDAVVQVFATATLQLRTTPDDPGGSPTWSDWEPLFLGDYEARAFQFKQDLATTEEMENISVTTLKAIVDMPDRTERDLNVAVSAAGQTITFTNAFRAQPAVAITAQDLATGDYWAITNDDADGFDVRFFDSADVGVARTMNWIAKGYGRKAA